VKGADDKDVFRGQEVETEGELFKLCRIVAANTNSVKIRDSILGETSRMEGKVEEGLSRE